jgi:hypothetical protein
MRALLAQVFGAHVLALKVDATPARGRRGDDRSNAKMKRENSRFPYFVEAFVLPLQAVLDAQITPANAKGGYAKQARLEAGACSPACPHRFDNLGYNPALGGRKPKDACYVDLMRVITPALNRASLDLMTGATVDLTKGYELRLTGWGDIGRLNDSGLEEVARLQAGAGAHLTYTADWRDSRLKALGVQGCASVATLEQALEAERLGWRVYMSGGDKQAFRLQASSPVYKCPVGKPREQALGCTTCPLRCDGARHILSP